MVLLHGFRRRKLCRQNGLEPPKYPFLDIQIAHSSAVQERVVSVPGA
jgi:hypothetical protein